MKKINKLLFYPLLLTLMLPSCQTGPKDNDGQTPYIGSNGHWWIGNSDTGTNAQGPKGETGGQGQPGQPGSDGVTPQLKIGNDNYWYVSYDKGSTWTSLNIKATGDKGSDGQPGDKGEDGVTPKLDIGNDNYWYVSYDEGQTWECLDVKATGTDGEDGSTPQLKVGNDNYWYVSYDSGSSWISLNVKATGADGKDGNTGPSGKSAYELYKETYGYEGSETDWLNDLVNNRLGIQETFTVNFVTKYGIEIPALTIKKGNLINKNDIELPDGYSFGNKLGGAYYVPEGQTFDGDFSHYEFWSFIGYGVFSNMTLALDVYGPIEDVTNEKLVNLYGRNLIGDHQVTFYNAGSGFEVKFNGPTLKGIFKREQIVSAEATSGLTNIKLRAYVDGDMNIENSTLIVLNSKTDDKEITLLSGLTNGDHKVLIRKANYEDRGAVVFKGLSGANYFYTAPSKPKKKIMFIGDSLTVGYGVNYLKDDTVPAGTNVDTWEKEDNGKSYATLITDYFGAEYLELCVSGISLGVPSWRQFTWLERWNKYSYFSNVTCEKKQLESYNPDLIVINLGTNDETGLVEGASVYGKGSSYEQNKIASGELESQGYTMWNIGSNFYWLVKALKGLYPNAKVIGCTGMTSRNDATFSMYKYYIDNDKEGPSLVKEGYTGLYSFQFNTVETSTCAGHPTEIGQKDAFGQLRQFILDNNIL